MIIIMLFLDRAQVGYFTVYVTGDQEHQIINIMYPVIMV